MQLSIQRIKKSVIGYNNKTNLRAANADIIIKPFLHGLQLKHRRFGKYVFVPFSKDVESQLRTRSFTDLSHDLINEDSIIKLGDLVLHNKKFNLLFILVNSDNWNLLDASIDIAESSTKQFETQCHILLSSTQVLSDRLFEIKVAQK